MSNSSARRPQPASSGAQLSSASSASSRDEITPISSPVSLLHPGQERRRHWPPAGTPRWRSRAAGGPGAAPAAPRRPASAASARSMAAGLSSPVRCSPSPSRTMRLKLSSTRNPSPDGVATSMRQLLVPRSSAAKAGRQTAAARPRRLGRGLDIPRLHHCIVIRADRTGQALLHCLARISSRRRRSADAGGGHTQHQTADGRADRPTRHAKPGGSGTRQHMRVPLGPHQGRSLARFDGSRIEVAVRQQRGCLLAAVDRQRHAHHGALVFDGSDAARH